jgi:glycine/D-amino acid oxidase-like deaminating enzyme
MSCAVGISASRATVGKHLGSVGIIGGGFAGLAIAQELSHLCKELHIYDVHPVGEAAASSSAGGLLHPFAPRGNFVWKGREGFEATMSILRRLDNEGLNENDIVFSTNVPIHRFVFSEKELESWRKASIAHPDELEEISCQSYLTNLSNVLPTTIDNFANSLVGCMKLKESAIVHAPTYLKQLWKLIQMQCPESYWQLKFCSLDFVRDEVSKNHDVTIIAGGFASLLFLQDLSSELSIGFVKGRNLHYCGEQSSAGSSVLPHSILSGEYIVSRSTCVNDKHPGYEIIVGASHEHMHVPTDTNSIEKMLFANSRLTDSTSIESAKELLHGKLSPLVSFLPKANFVSKGVRLVTKRTNLGRLPIVDRLNHNDSSNNLWILTGLGSRGLVYHALMAKYLKEGIIHNDENLIPSVLRLKPHEQNR